MLPAVAIAGCALMLANEPPLVSSALQFGLELTVVPNTGLNEKFTSSSPLRFKLIVTNKSDQPLQILVKDHDDYHGTLKYPVELRVRLRRADGPWLTRGFNESCSFFDLWSTMFEEKPGDRITLPPKGKVVRNFDLRDVLMGCPGFDEPLSGVYEIQFLLGTLTSTVDLLNVYGEP